MVSKSEKTQVGRIALREEGEWWVGYYADANTMDGAIELARIKMSIVITHPEVKQTFMGMMRMVISEAMVGVFGKAPEWKDPKGAPEHERAGRA